MNIWEILIYGFLLVNLIFTFISEPITVINFGKAYISSGINLAKGIGKLGMKIFDDFKVKEAINMTNHNIGNVTE